MDCGTVNENERLCGDSKYCCRKKCFYPAVVYVLFTLLVLTTIGTFGGLGYAWYEINSTVAEYGDRDLVRYLNRVLIAETLALLPIYAIGMAKLIAGSKWVFCGR